MGLCAKHLRLKTEELPPLVRGFFVANLESKYKEIKDKNLVSDSSSKESCVHWLGSTRPADFFLPVGQQGRRNHLPGLILDGLVVLKVLLQFSISNAERSVLDYRNAAIPVLLVYQRKITSFVLHPIFLSNMENITEKNTKAEILAAAVPLIDDQAERINELSQKFDSLLWITGVLAIWVALF